MSIRSRHAITPGAKVGLNDIDPNETNGFDGRGAVEARMVQIPDLLREQQTKLYAERQRAVLVCLQGMDSAGKDGVIRHVFSAMNPMGCRVTSFKQPAAQEKAHDFLWRYHAAVPEKGWVGIFNRSHYESAVVERVQKLIDRAACSRRFAQINDFERMMVENGTTILKFFLHISKDEQLARFKARLDDPLKRWKISEADYQQRELWEDHMAAYADAISKTSTAVAPWYIIPSNHKWFRDFAIGEIVTETLEDLAIAVPKPSVDIDDIRRRYHEAERAARSDRTPPNNRKPKN